MAKKITPVVIAIIKHDDKFLLTKRREYKSKDSKYHDLWQFPGGGINFGETPEVALHREIREELGVAIKIISKFPKVMTEVRESWQGLFLIFLCELTNINDQIVLNNEASEYGWYSLREIQNLNRLPLTYEACKEISDLL